MRESNYEKTRNRMRAAFLKYDQRQMVEKFHLEQDAQFLYMNFCGRKYALERSTGRVLWQPRDSAPYEEADFNVSMTLYDVLCCSAEGCRAAGRFCTLYAAKGCVNTVQVGENYFQTAAQYFSGRVGLLRAACERIGELSGMKGDLSAIIPAFDFLPVCLRFWDADDEFPASLQILYDENILDFMRFETVFYMTDHLLDRIRETADLIAVGAEQDRR